MKLLKQNQIGKLIKDSQEKLEENMIAIYNRKELSDVLQIPNNEELIIMAFEQLRKSKLMSWYKLYIIYNEKDNNFIVVPYLF
jgi:hypothetical protein|nr:MAG TPA: hypothetical protein [Caudoviricetes sp.]